MQADQAEGDDVETEQRAIEQRAITTDDAALLEPFQPPQARRSRDADAARKFHIGHAPVILQFAQDLPVDGIELGPHRYPLPSLPGRYIHWRFTPACYMKRQLQPSLACNRLYLT